MSTPNFFQQPGPPPPGQDFFQQPISQAPIVNRFGNDGAVFGGAGNSHFTHNNGRFHETTQVPGFGKKEGLDNGLKLNLDIPLGGF